jgi:signal peptidase I
MMFAALSRVLLAAVLSGGAVAARAAIAERPLTRESFATALSDAHRLAARSPELQVLRVEGRSMLPFFGEGSVVVIKKIDVDALRPGMVVVYQNRFGDTVAHRVIDRATDGWVTQGYNNKQADTTRVCAENLLGVVYATLHSNGRSDDIAEFALLTAKTATVLAAPAK